MKKLLVAGVLTVAGVSFADPIVSFVPEAGIVKAGENADFAAGASASLKLDRAKLKAKLIGGRDYSSMSISAGYTLHKSDVSLLNVYAGYELAGYLSPLHHQGNAVAVNSLRGNGGADGNSVSLQNPRNPAGVPAGYTAANKNESVDVRFVGAGIERILTEDIVAAVQAAAYNSAGKNGAGVFFELRKRLAGNIWLGGYAGKRDAGAFNETAAGMRVYMVW